MLLAISGGLDSVVLAHLLKKSGFQFSLAHCNFQLRGKESDADEKFCRALAKKLGVEIFTTRFNTKDYCTEHKVNVQLAARKLRYDWFDTLLKKHSFEYLLTAHQANDVTETLFINLLRGTGINGLKGIPVQNGKVVRPLLNFKREELESFAKKEKILFRTDKSNLEDKYERNFIRLNIIPALKTLNPTLEDTILKNTSHLVQEAGIVAEFLEGKAAELITQTHDFVFIDKKKLVREKYAETILHHLIGGYGFNETQEQNILKNLRENAQIGKLFISDRYQLSIDRNDLVIRERTSDGQSESRISSLEAFKKSRHFKISTLRKFVLPKQQELLLNSTQLIYPLIIRQRRTGDKFKPFGMKGFKLLSDFLKEQKLNTFERETCKVLINGNGEIIWVIGLRSDDRYKVNKTDTPLLKLSYLD